MVLRALALAALVMAPVQAQAADYLIKLRGITVGTLSVKARAGGSGFDYETRFRTTGVAGAVRNVRFVMRSLGAMAGHLPVPRAYGEQMNTGARESAASIKFSADDGRWDPNTALVFAFSDRPRAAGCTIKRTLYDGERTNDLSLAEVRRSGAALSCAGSMTRVAGYTAEQMAKRPHHNLSVDYVLAGDTYRFTGARVQTDYGSVTITPR
ncbi:DUF3108 domain-containing protein [Maritimibacter sp. UBA3975]|uniref:DUF3108 domain-containing protein n=1 Tax=Maritimibacter sp. UBA3975 TaxID=1946833 RepID=UPI0025C69407|nr:DUF3108 domain-containing protein [Maritimibacter sp. UBA3975]